MQASSHSLKQQQTNLPTEKVERAMIEVSANLIPVLTVYCNDFASKFGSVVEQVAYQYAERLIANGIGLKGMERGIERLKRQSATKPWTPNPEQFAQMCKPSADEAGIPSVDDIYQEIVEARGRYRFEQYQFSHQIGAIINERIGFEFYQESEGDFKRRLQKEYDHWTQRALKGDLPAPMKAIAHKSEPPLPDYLKNPTGRVSGPLGEKIEALKQLAKQRKNVELTAKQ